MTRAHRSCAARLFYTLASLLVCFCFPESEALAQVVSSNYSFLDTSWGLNFTTNGNAQSGWLVTGGNVAGTVVSVNSDHWVNGSLYYLGYVFDSSFTYSPTTGVWGNTNNASATSGFLSGSADSVIVSVTFPQSVNVGMMRFYPGGYTSGTNTFAGTDYAVSYQQGTNWNSLIPLQGISNGTVQTYIDHTFSNAVSAQNWRITLSNGTGGWQGNATFGEVQFFTTTPGNNLWAPTAGGGSGVWSSNSTNWASASGQLGTSNIATMGSAYFGGSAGTVDVSGTVRPVAGMRFATDGYVVTNGTISLAANSNVFNQIIADTNVGVRIESVLAGSNGMTKGGVGTVTLNGNNTYTGGTFINDGTLVGSTTTIRGAISNDGAVIFSQGTNGTVSNVVSGTGLLTKTGAGTLTLGGTNTYTGGTLVSGGALAGNADALQGAITNNAAVIFNQATNDTYAGVMSGSGTMSKTGNGTLTLSGANTYSGGTLVSGGTLSGNADAIQGAITNNAAVTFNQATNDTYAGAMSGSGTLTKIAAGTLTLSGSNSYSGSTRIQAGAIEFATTASLYGGNTANWTASNIIVSNGASLVLAGGSAGQFTASDIASLLGNLTTVNSNGLQAGAILGLDVTDSLSVTSAVANSTGAGGGSVSLVKFGTGTLTLSASNGYTGGTLVTAGRLVGDSLSIRGALTNNAAVTFDQAGAGTYSNAISGSGSLTKSSSGTLTLSGVNTYSGGTLVSGGTLSGNADALQGAITNNAAVVFNQATNDSYAGVISGTGSFVKSGAGNLTNTANSTYSGVTTVQAGRLVINGTNTNTATTINSGAYLGGTGRVGAVTVGGTIAPGNSVGTLRAGSTVFDAAGAYDLEMFNWSNSAGTGWDLLAITGNLTFSNTIDNPFAVNLISMSSSTARGLSANFNANKNYTNTFATYTGTLAGTEFNQNLFTVNTGSFSNSFGGTFRVTTNAGGLAILYLANFDPSAPYAWTNGTGAWTFNAGWTNDATPTNGAVIIIKGAGGSTTNNGLVSQITSLTFSNTTGSATLAGTVLTIGSNGVVNASSNAHTLNTPVNLTTAASFNAASNNLTFGGNVTNAGSLLTVTGSYSTTINGAIGGAGGLLKVGTGTLNLGGANSYSGGTLVSEGTLSGSTTSLRDNVTNNAVLQFNQSTNGTYSNVVSGTGLLVKAGVGTVTLAGTNTYTGGTLVSGGRLVADTTTLPGNITNNAAVTFNQSGNGIFSNVMSGTGSMAKTGAGSLTVASANSYSGTTTVSAGTLVVDGSITNSSVTVQSGATLAGSGSVGGIVLNVGGTVNPGNSPGTLNVTGNATWNPGGNYNWQIYNATGSAGSTNGWDFLNVTGSLNLSNLSVGSEFNINLWSLSGISPDTNGSAVNFDPNQNYTWKILTAAGGIGGFDASYFKLNTFGTNGTGGFLNSLAGGAFSLGVSGNDLNLLFTAAGPAGVPEPGTWVAAALLIGGAAFARWRRARIR